MSLTQRQFEAEAEEESGDWVCKASVKFPQDETPRNISITVGRNNASETVNAVKTQLLNNHSKLVPSEYDMVGNLDGKSVPMKDDKLITEYMNYINNGIISFQRKA